MRTFFNFFIFIIVCTIIIGKCANGCNDNATTSAPEYSYNTKDVEPALPVEVNNGNFSDAEIAKYGIAAIFSRNPSIIKVKPEGDIYKVSYRYNGSLNEYKVRIRANKIMWGNYDGRWREHPDDEKYYFNAIGNKITITSEYSDGSISEEKYKK